MKNSVQIFLVAMLALFSSNLFAGERVGDFALIDHLGAQHHMSWYDDQNAVVILPYANGATYSIASLTDLQAKYTDQGVVFFLMNPGTETDRKVVGADAAVKELALPVLMDDTQIISEALGFTNQDQAVVYDPKSFELLYRGPADGQMEQAIEGLIEGENRDLIALPTNGTAIEYTSGNVHAIPSYINDVAPIIVENCANCHREGAIAPFAMDSKLALQGWSPMIREVIMTKRMPPGQLDNKVGYRTKNMMNLTDAETQTLVRWVDAGSPVDGDSDPLANLAWPDTNRTLAETLGEPDLIIKIPPQPVPATGIVDYRDIPIDLGLTEDKWVRASEVAADKKEALHHIITTMIPPGGAADVQAMFIAAINSLPEERAAAIRADMFAAVAAGEQPDIDKIFSENPDIDVVALLSICDPEQCSIPW